MDIWKASPINCVAVRLMTEVAMAAQTKIGMRKGVMPLARSRITEARIFSALRMEEKLERETPRKNI